LLGKPGLITLTFRNLTPGTVSKGPMRSFRIDRELVTDDRGGPLAVHVGHCWHVGEESFVRLDCADAVKVQFERDGAAASEVYGPFIHLSSTDGICYADHEVFAHFDEDTKTWFCHRDREYWPSLVVRSLTWPGG
jgi:hypothetical protein